MGSWAPGLAPSCHLQGTLEGKGCLRSWERSSLLTSAWAECRGHRRPGSHQRGPAGSDLGFHSTPWAGRGFPTGTEGHFPTSLLSGDTCLIYCFDRINPQICHTIGRAGDFDF